MIVGGGAAGLRAAIAAAETSARPERGPRLQGLSHAQPHRLGRGRRRRGVAPDDSLDGHAFDTIKGCDYIADQDVVETFVERGAARS